MTGQLAQLFVDLTLRGGGKVDLIAMRDKISAADKSLANNASLYKRQTSAKLTQMIELANKQAQLSRLDAATYATPKYAKVAAADRHADTQSGLAGAAKQKAQLLAELKSIGTPGGMKFGDEEFANSKLGSRIKMLNQQKMIERDIKFLKSPQSVEVANLANQNRRLGKQRDELANYRQMVAENGKLHAILTRVNDGVAAVGRATGVAYFAIDAAILGAVAASSPDTFQTFTMSLKLLSAEIGTIFLPYIIQAAYWIQQAAHYVRGLTPETREQILTWTKWGLGIALATFAAVKIVGVIHAISAAFVYLKSVMMGINFALVFNPMVLGITAAVAAIGLLIYNLQQMQAQRAATEAMIQSLKAGGSVTRQDYEKNVGAQARNYLESSPDRETRDARLQALRERTERQIATLEPQAAAAQRTITRVDAQLGPESWTDIFANPSGMAARRERTEARQTISGLQDQRAALEIVKALQEGRTKRDGENRPDLASTFTAQFTSFEQGWRRIQQEAASKGPIEERMLTIAEQSRDYLKNINANQKEQKFTPLVFDND